MKTGMTAEFGRGGLLANLEMPADATFAARRRWVFERLREIRRGVLTGQRAALVASAVAGWADLGPLDERRQYREWSRDINIARGHK